MKKEELKEYINNRIEGKREEIISIGEEIFRHPELGYKEKRTTDYVANIMKELGMKLEKNIAITGCRGIINGNKKGPTVAVLGELDALICKEHPAADPVTGAVHACGHNTQIAAMLGVAFGIIDADVLAELAGEIHFMAVPAEEYLEIEYRSSLVDNGEISFLGGKQELVKRGYFDGVDLTMMMHALDLSSEGKKVLIGPQGNGFLGKKIQFIGKESHAGAAPEKGVNALNAAMLALMNIHAQRETFSDDDKVRVHPIITKGGDVVSVVPADVRMETYVRARSIEAIKKANLKTNRALIAGAAAVGAKVIINEFPGYLPLYNCPSFDEILRDNLKGLLTEDEIKSGTFFTGSFDLGDISHLMPVLHPFFSGVRGDLHTRDFKVEDPDLAYILPAKALAFTLVDLLYDQGQIASNIKEGFTPLLAKKEYLELLNGMLTKIEK
jgi:amidohydrolase